MRDSRPATPVIVGLDIGGTKAAVVVETLDGTRLIDTVLPSSDWDAEPIDHGTAWIASAVSRTLPADATPVMVGVGAQGLDAVEVVDELTAALSAAGLPSVCVNDAQLLVPAAGLDAGIGVIAGTGAIAVGRSAAGNPMAAGGWGAVIGDEAGAAGLVRLATIAALDAHEDGLADRLLDELLDEFAVPDAERLARAVNDVPTPENWAPHARAVFRAADAGSPAALSVVETAVEHLARLVDRLVRRGAVGDTVVCAGSVIAGQHRLLDGVIETLARRQPQLRVLLLEVNPVEGAVTLARRRLGRR